MCLALGCAFYAEFVSNETARLDDKETGRDRPVINSFHEGACGFDDVIYLTNLFVECAQDISLIDTKSLAEIYRDGEAVFYVLLVHCLPHGREYKFPFLIGQNMLELGWPHNQFIDEAPAEGKSMVEMRLDCDQINPVLIGVGDFVNGPENLIPSGIWSLGAKEVPLYGCEFLFQLLDSSGVWEFIRLPGIPIYSPEGKPYARCANAVSVNHSHDKLVQSRSDALNDLDAIERDVDIEIFFAACDYVKQISISFDADGVGVRLHMPIDSRYKLLKFARSTSDIFL